MDMDTDDALALHAAILAAEPSARYGSPRQLARLDGGRALHRAVASAGCVAGHSVSVVLGADAREVAPALRQSSASVVLNRHWAEGPASSIRAAVRSAPPRCEGLLLLRADPLGVSGEDLRRLFSAWRRHPVLISAAVHAGTAGLPAIFPRWSFADLMELRGDHDAGRVLRRNSDRLVRVAMTSASAGLDAPQEPRALEVAAARATGAVS